MFSIARLLFRVLSTLCTSVAIYIILLVAKEIRYRVAAKKAGCSTPVRYLHKDPIFGIDLFVRRAKDMKAGNSMATDREILDMYGKTVLTNNFGTKQYITMDSANMQTVLATEVDRFGNAPLNYKMCKPFLGEGIITFDGPQWKHSRQLLNPVFARAQVAELSSFEVHLRKMISQIPRDGSTVDIQPLCKMLFLDSSTEFIFGKSANSLDTESNNTIARRLSIVFDEALQTMFMRYMLGNLKFLVGGGHNGKWKKTCGEVQSIIDGFVSEEYERQAVASKTGKEDDVGTPYKYVLLKELVRSTDDRILVRNELMNVFFPARDTAGILTSNIIFLLARYPAVWKRIRSEVQNFGDQKLTFESLKTLKYIHYVMNETLRLQTPVGGSWKTCISQCILPHGGGSSGQEPILLQPGDEVRMSFTPMHTDPEIWGKDAAEFKPERWVGLKQSWNFIPFMGGRRICPAQQNVYTDVAYILVRLAREFKAIENRDEQFEYVDNIVFVRESKNGVKVAFIPV
ncbi:cytochrome P450 alkane hydroxylase-like protein [Tricladium varicosporioides]|nr:cytochrome P450 alkane hydroxylase-like protein [Hymenoscyphus varicosporioides]